MLTPNSIRQQTDRIVAYLVEVGLASDQNVAILRNKGRNLTEVTFPHAEEVSITLKKRSYAEIYKHLASERAYTVKMPDGALILIRYEYEANILKRHTLGFYPSPNLEDFQSNPEIYMEDIVYADVTAPNIVPFPVRFDFDCSEGTCMPVKHPKSHLTLGQYARCRIPVTAPLTPYWFVSFVLRNFYNTAFEEYESKMPRFSDIFEDSIYSEEQDIMHVRIPSAI
jgi:hypothetical protein